MSAFVLSPGERDIGRVVQAIIQLIRGRNDATGSVTLRASQTTTVVAAPNCGVNSAVFLFPQTAHAAAIVAQTYVRPADVIAGQFTITHASDANTDKSFFFVCLG